LTHRNTLGGITERLTAKAKQDIGFERYHSFFLSGSSFLKPLFYYFFAFFAFVVLIKIGKPPALPG
jgi:hypothetical protein